MKNINYEFINVIQANYDPELHRFGYTTQTIRTVLLLTRDFIDYYKT